MFNFLIPNFDLIANNHPHFTNYPKHHSFGAMIDIKGISANLSNSIEENTNFVKDTNSCKKTNNSLDSSSSCSSLNDNNHNDDSIKSTRIKEHKSSPYVATFSDKKITRRKSFNCNDDSFEFMDEKENHKDFSTEHLNIEGNIKIIRDNSNHKTKSILKQSTKFSDESKVKF